MTTKARFLVSFSGYWISGTGAARGRDVDVVTHRDQDGLPAMPMTQIKGQLRETAQRLAAAANVAEWTDDKVLQFFGPAADDEDLDDRLAGALAFRGEARLPEPVRLWLAQAGNESVRTQFYRRLPATAIGRFGAAQDHTLRSVEAVIPLELEGRLEWVAASPPPGDWKKALNLACAATLAFGKLKADGYGRALAEVK